MRLPPRFLQNISFSAVPVSMHAQKSNKASVPRTLQRDFRGPELEPWHWPNSFTCHTDHLSRWGRVDHTGGNQRAFSGPASPQHLINQSKARITTLWYFNAHFYFYFDIKYKTDVSGVFWAPKNMPGQLINQRVLILIVRPIPVPSGRIFMRTTSVGT
jgi:hypothetical protein